MKISNEARVGALVLGTAVFAALFAWVIGIPNPLTRSTHFYVTYNYAGGIEIGSPVRVSGIKVGKVERIEFFVPKDASKVATQEPGSPGKDLTGEKLDGKAIIPLRLKISVDKEASAGVRTDSKFYVNMAGIIGERYIEIIPGEMSSPEVKDGAELAGIDPPRFDQLISQSFDLAGKIKDIIEHNKGDFSKTFEILAKLSGNINQTLKWLDESNLRGDTQKLIGNLIQITSDMRIVTDKAHTPEGERTLRLLYQLLWRLEPLDREAIKKFFQQEGVKAKIF